MPTADASVPAPLLNIVEPEDVLNDPGPYAGSSLTIVLAPKWNEARSRVTTWHGRTNTPFVPAQHQRLAGTHVGLRAVRVCGVPHAGLRLEVLLEGLLVTTLRTPAAGDHTLPLGLYKIPSGLAVQVRCDGHDLQLSLAFVEDERKMHADWIETAYVRWVPPEATAPSEDVPHQLAAVATEAPPPPEARLLGDNGELLATGEGLELTADSGLYSVALSVDHDTRTAGDGPLHASVRLDPPQPLWVATKCILRITTAETWVTDDIAAGRTSLCITPVVENGPDGWSPEVTCMINPKWHVVRSRVALWCGRTNTPFVPAEHQQLAGKRLRLCRLHVCDVPSAGLPLDVLMQGTRVTTLRAPAAGDHTLKLDLPGIVNTLTVEIRCDGRDLPLSVAFVEDDMTPLSRNGPMETAYVRWTAPGVALDDDDSGDGAALHQLAAVGTETPPPPHARLLGDGDEVLATGEDFAPAEGGLYCAPLSVMPTSSTVVGDGPLHAAVRLDPPQPLWVATKCMLRMDTPEAMRARMETMVANLRRGRTSFHTGPLTTDPF